MALNAKYAPKASGGGNRIEQPTIDPGTYPARLAQIISLGLQPQRAYKGEDKPPAPEIMLTYELLDTFMVDEDGNELTDKPRWISETIPFRNLEADLATSTKRYKALDPDMDYDGDFSALLGTPCNVTIVVNEGKGKNAGKKYENIQTISAMRPKDAAKAEELKNAPRLFDIEEPDMEVFLALPEWIQTKIKGNLQFNGSVLEKALKGNVGASKESAKLKAQEAAAEADFDAHEDNEDQPW